MKFCLRLVLAALCLLLLMPVFARAASSGTEITLGGRHTVYWEPSDPGKGKQPLLLFSHGFKGCSTQSTFLTEALADDGYWVFAPDHDDASCKRGGLFKMPEHSFVKPELWDDTTYTDRADDMRNVLDALQHNPQFKDRIDFERIGLVGHSLGGYTALALGGAWASWKLPGVKAVLALSPYSHPFNVKHTLAALTVPVMYQGGTRDGGITPWVKKDGGSYDQTPAPKYFIEFDRANHFAWTDLSHQYRGSIIAYSEAFLDHYVKGLPATPVLTKPRADVSEMKFDSDLGKYNSASSGN